MAESVKEDLSSIDYPIPSCTCMEGVLSVKEDGSKYAWFKIHCNVND